MEDFSWDKLPPEVKREAIDFIEYLMSKRRPAKQKPSLSWAGALRDYKGQYTSVELQQKASDWR